MLRPPADPPPMFRGIRRAAIPFDIPVVVEYGLPTDQIILSDYTNFIYALDAEGDQDHLQIVDFSKTTLDRRIGARADLKCGFYVVNTNQVCWYGGSAFC